MKWSFQNKTLYLPQYDLSLADFGNILGLDNSDENANRTEPVFLENFKPSRKRNPIRSNLLAVN